MLIHNPSIWDPLKAKKTIRVDVSWIKTWRGARFIGIQRFSRREGREEWGEEGSVTEAISSANEERELSTNQGPPSPQLHMALTLIY